MHITGSFETQFSFPTLAERRVANLQQTLHKYFQEPVGLYNNTSAMQYQLKNVCKCKIDPSVFGYLIRFYYCADAPAAMLNVIAKEKEKLHSTP